MFRSFALIALLMPTSVGAQSLWEAEGARVQTVIYRCDSAVESLSVAYFTAADATGFAAVQIGGIVHAMVQAPSGSGVRYVDINEETGYRLHTKGDGLLLSKLAPDHTAEEELLAECRVTEG